MQNEIQKDEKNVVEAGFTLVELLIVIVIMGILAGIVVFAVGNLTDNASKNACKTEGDTFATAVQAYKADGNPGGALDGDDLAADAQSLADADLLNSETTKYGGVANGWTYAGGKVDTSACA